METSKQLTSNLIFTADLAYFDEINAMDVGKELAKVLKPRLKKSNVALFAVDKLYELIEAHSFKLGELGAGYALKNIGILFEPDLQVDFVALCRKFSRDSYLIIEHKGALDKENLYFLTRRSGKEIDIKDLNYTII